jgi:hypothetical protein
MKLFGIFIIVLLLFVGLMPGIGFSDEGPADTGVPPRDTPSRDQGGSNNAGNSGFVQKDFSTSYIRPTGLHNIAADTTYVCRSPSESPAFKAFNSLESGAPQSQSTGQPGSGQGTIK